MNWRLGAVVFFFTLLSTAVVAEGPLPVSPGAEAGLAVVLGRCPTFQWTAVEGAQSVDLVVYRLPEKESEDQPAPVLTVAFPGSAHGWTPSLGECLEPGQRYAWSVRATSESGDTEWSEASLFEVSAAPSMVEVEDALAVLRRYLEEGSNTARRESAAAETTVARQTATEAAAPLPGVAAPDPGSEGRSLTVDSNIELGSASNLFKDGKVLLWTDGFEGNTAVGEGALKSNGTGSENTAVGHEALTNNTMGNLNTAVGSGALDSNGTGSFNTAVGRDALLSNTMGNYNTAVGLHALRLARGSYNVALGKDAGADIDHTGGNFNIMIGNDGLSGDANTIRIGAAFDDKGDGDPSNDTGQSKVFLHGIDSNTVMGGIVYFDSTTGQLGSALNSSRSFKEEIQDLGAVSSGLLDLHPVQFRYKGEVVGSGLYPTEFGLIAEEVAEVLPELVHYGHDGRPSAVRYRLLAPLLLSELQKQHRRIRVQGWLLLVMLLAGVGVAVGRWRLA